MAASDIDANADAATTADDYLVPDILSTMFRFIDVSEVSAVSQTSKTWKDALDSVEVEHWECLAKKHHPTLERLMGVLPDDPSSESAVIVGDNEADRRLPSLPSLRLTSKSWKEMFRRMATSPYEPLWCNKQLQKDLEIMFREDGIVAFSNCCHFHCSSAYNEGKGSDTFESRDTGIYFIRLSLNGMNYDPWCGGQTQVAASYGDFDYLMEHWDEECQVLTLWCAVLGLKPGEFRVEKPSSEWRAVLIHFLKKVEFEEVTCSSDEDEEMDDEQDEDMSEE